MVRREFPSLAESKWRVELWLLWVGLGYAQSFDTHSFILGELRVWTRINPSLASPSFLYLVILFDPIKDREKLQFFHVASF